MLSFASPVLVLSVTFAASFRLPALRLGRTLLSSTAKVSLLLDILLSAGLADAPILGPHGRALFEPIVESDPVTVKFEGETLRSANRLIEALGCLLGESGGASPAEICRSAGGGGSAPDPLRRVCRRLAVASGTSSTIR